jgi:threonine 3-dehydrogenase
LNLCVNLRNLWITSLVQKMMKAVVKARAEPGLWLEEVPIPEVRGDDVLIRVLKTSICGTDVTA